MDPHVLILYEDEMDLDWNPRTTRVWARQGEPMWVMTPGQNKKKTVFGAVSTDGRLFYSIKERKRAVNFIEFLEYLLGRVAAARQRVLMILDRYGIHTAKVVQRFVANTQGRLQLVWLPSYCPNDNPQEKVWSSLQRAVLHNCYHDSLAEREQVTRRYLARLQQTGRIHLLQA
jgi:transposase